jgi:hypothetical protein
MNTPVFNQPNSAAPQPSITQGITTPPVASVPNFSGSPVPKAKKSLPMSTVLGGLLFVLVSVGAAVTMYLNNQNQDVRQQASTDPYAISCASPNYCASTVECENGTAGGTCGSGKVCCKGASTPAYDENGCLPGQKAPCCQQDKCTVF